MSHIISKLKYSTQRGFTLPELLVSIGIIILILSVTLINYQRFDSTTVFTNTMYDVGLSIRKAQVYGISVKGVGGDVDFQFAYGVRFYNPSTTNNQFVLFRDSLPASIQDSMYNGQLACTAAGDQECVEKFTISKARVTDICVQSQAGRTCGLATVDITFKRPNPDAIIIPSPSVCGAGECSEAIIKFESQDTTYKKSISVLTTGQITVSSGE